MQILSEMSTVARHAFRTPQSRNLLGGDLIPISPFVIGMVREPHVVPAAFDAGINAFFLSADMHWPLYESLRKGLEMLFERPHVREQVCVMAVSYVTQAEFTVAPFHEVLESVHGLRYLDVTVIGGAYEDNFRSRLERYRNHRTGAVPGVRATAASFHQRTACARALAEQLVDLAFVRYNPSHRNAEADVFKSPRASGSLLYNFNSTRGHVTRARFAELGLDDDFWCPEVYDYYRFALTTRAFDGLLCSFRSVQELCETLDGVARGPLSAEDFQYMADLADLSSGRAKLVPDDSFARSEDRPDAPLAE